ncbi:hypothetical protein C8R45DRAFT_1081035 [Mycena sanguinolenta]|nr:hypothetical protein C8R45DRAFT_1081035 [Mycena sanguinolenta]
MFTRKSALACAAIFLALAAQTSAHAMPSIALGVKGAPKRSDVQRPSTASPCGKVAIAANLDTSTAIPAAADGSVTMNVQNFNAGADGSTSVSVEVDQTGVGNKFVAGTVKTNGNPKPTKVETDKIVFSLPAGTKCSGGKAKNLCLVSVKTTAGFGACTVVSQGQAAVGTVPPAKGTVKTTTKAAAKTTANKAAVKATTTKAAVKATTTKPAKAVVTKVVDKTVKVVDKTVKVVDKTVDVVDKTVIDKTTVIDKVTKVVDVKTTKVVDVKTTKTVDVKATATAKSNKNTSSKAVAGKTQSKAGNNGKMAAKAAAKPTASAMQKNRAIEAVEIREYEDLAAREYAEVEARDVEALEVRDEASFLRFAREE